ncbi:MAG: nitronate monooxygenase [Desulfobacterales bacterium]|nr:nitronate monooxygenase [Desulfobacterales bacterium]
MDFNIISKLQLPKIDLSNIEWPKFDVSMLQWSQMPKLKIGDAVARLPIIQGGMGVGISLSKLSSAVANEGGIGVIAANSIGMLNPEYYAKHKDANSIALRQEIRKARKMTSGLIGVNIMVAVDDFLDLLRVSMEEGADMVFLGAGLPIKNIPVKELREAGVKVVPIVSSGRAAKLIFKSWMKSYNDIPDAVVVEGPMAGGHLGFKADQIDDPDFVLENIVPDVIAEIKVYEEKCSRSIPVIAAGGIFTGADISKFFKLGARGVQMGTRFVATHECDADIRFKQAYVSCKEGDVGIIKSPVGLPGRAIQNQFLKDAAEGKKRKGLRCAWKCLKSCDLKTAKYCISLALDNARKGNLEEGFAFAGSNAYRVENIVAVKELMQELKRDYLVAEKAGAGRLRGEYEKALERLSALKEEYTVALTSLQEEYGKDYAAALSVLQEEYGKSLEASLLAFQDKYPNAMDKISKLKEEYSKAVDRASALKADLVAMFERSSGISCKA